MGAQWAEFAVQLAALVGGFLYYWRYKSRPRVSLRLAIHHFICLEVVHLGGRTAKDVQVEVEPPLDLEKVVRSSSEGEVFGPAERFGDMAAGQQYNIAVTLASKDDILDGLDTKFRVSWEGPFGLRRKSGWMKLGGSGLEHAGFGDATTAQGRAAESLDEIKNLMERFESQLTTTTTRLLHKPPTGGEWISEKRCRSCGWNEFYNYPTPRQSKFRCTNCRFVFDVECECKGTWCDHTPAPRQCHQP